ncbi:GTP-binding protein [Patescibacteria group bacterium]|nr:GTP-binding protein [Patescibacteria group bacterium]
MNKKIPVTIFSGFLGSGKTTIILGLIDYLQSIGEQVVYIKNELGSMDIDAEIVRSKKIESKKILNGCIYHTLLGPLNTAINDLIDKSNPDRIIIETAGTDKTENKIELGSVIDGNPRLIRDGLVTVIDVVNFQGYKYLDDYTRDQANFIDLVVFNKVEQVDEARKRIVVGYIREFNERSPIVEAPNGKLDPQLAFGMNILSKKNHDKTKKSDHINTFSFTSDKVFDIGKLEKVFANFPKNVIRFKGYIKTTLGIQIINGVYKRFDWFPVTKDCKIDKTQLIIVGYEVKNDYAQITKLLDACTV